MWRKAHFAVDTDSHEIIATVASLDTVHDSEALPTLLNPLRRQIGQMSGDSAYDTKRCYEVLKRKGIVATIPPRKNAGYWHEGHPRNLAVEALKNGVLKQWKRDSGYHERSLSETAVYRYKQLLSEKLSFRNYNAQVGEIMAGVAVLNKMLRLGMPVRQTTE